VRFSFSETGIEKEEGMVEENSCAMDEKRGWLWYHVNLIG
jgi:hypothetical protein